MTVGNYTIIRQRFMDDDAPRIVSKYIVSIPIKFTGKTWVYEINSKSSGESLGYVKWYGPWRQYWFEPYNAGFNSGCLKDITQFLDDLMEERRISKIKEEKH